MKEIDYLSLAKQARLDGKSEVFWACFKNHARVMRKLLAKEKTAVPAAAPQSSNQE
ncbi:hypothetical protein [Gorillibacterium sp. CAU 1737]|uniref:hypothetical protein n=1 Tax=Gorillibacterium sp. CAU 1737 TaxID=3140362 RepID=UPI00326111CC